MLSRMTLFWSSHCLRDIVVLCQAGVSCCCSSLAKKDTDFSTAFIQLSPFNELRRNCCSSRMDMLSGKCRVEEEEQRFREESQNRGLPFLPLCVEPLCIKQPIHQEANRGQRVGLLLMWSQRKLYSIRCAPRQVHSLYLEIFIERWSAEVANYTGKMAEASYGKAFSLRSTEESHKVTQDINRMLYAQVYSDYATVLNDLSHGDVKDVFGQLCSFLKDSVLAPTISSPQATPALEFDVALLNVLVGVDVCNWAGHNLPSPLRNFFAGHGRKTYRIANVAVQLPSACIAIGDNENWKSL
jgi:hypothetical protein